MKEGEAEKRSSVEVVIKLLLHQHCEKEGGGGEEER